MTNNKRFISLTGTTCAGKSTALKALKQSGAERFMVIPQVTRRNPRTDDAPECFIYTKNIIPNEMFLYNKDLSYGISRQSLLDFMNSDCQIAAGKLVRWRCTPQPYGLAVQRLLAFPRRTSVGSVTGHCFASPTLRQLSTITKSLREGGFLLWCRTVCNYRTENYDEYKQLGYKIGLFICQKFSANMVH